MMGDWMTNDWILFRMKINGKIENVVSWPTATYIEGWSGPGCVQLEYYRFIEELGSSIKTSIIISKKQYYTIMKITREIDKIINRDFIFNLDDDRGYDEEEKGIHLEG